MRIKLLTTLALLLMAVSGAWAQDKDFYLDNINGTSATLKYGNRQPGYPYFDGTWHPNGYFDDDQFKAFKEVTCQTITVDASCQNFEGTSLANLFEGWSGLTTINNLGNLKTSEITNMSNMFKGCSALTTLDLSGWDTFKVTDMSNMFYGCTNLTTIYVGDGWNTASSANNMFANCTSLPNFKSSEVNGTHATTDPGGYLSVKVIWDNTNIFKSTNADNYVNGSHRSQTFEGVTISTNVSSTSSLIPYNSEGKASLEVYGNSGDSFTFTTPEGMNFSKIEITGNDDITFNAYGDWTKPEDTKIVWSGTAESTVTLDGNDNTTCHNLKSIVLTLQPFPANYYLYLVVDESDNSKATLKYGEPGSGNPYYQGNRSDPWISNGYSGDFLDFKGNVCKTITVDANTCKNFNGGNLESLFDGWNNLTTINGLKNLNTSNVHYMDYMFRYCWYLTTLDLSGWNTSNVETMTEMFKDCNNLTTLNLSGWNTSNVETMTEMFFKCYYLATLTFGNGWDTSNVTDMTNMFRECRKNLTTLDLSGWNTSKVGKMSGMFYHCHNLETIYVGDGWSTTKVTDSGDMFNNCTSLPNWESTNPTDKTHANTGASGYLNKVKLAAHEGATGEYWATYYNGTHGFTADANTTVYQAKVNGTKTAVVLTEVTSKEIPADKGVVLKSSDESIILSVATTTATYSDNDLLGTDVDLATPANAYCLSKETTGSARGVGFYLYTPSDGAVIPAHRAYLQIPSSARSFYGFGDDNYTTDIDLPKAVVIEDDGLIYDLSGRRVTGQPKKGIYVKNGKLFVIK